MGAKYEHLITLDRIWVTNLFRFRESPSEFILLLITNHSISLYCMRVENTISLHLLWEFLLIKCSMLFSGFKPKSNKGVVQKFPVSHAYLHARSFRSSCGISLHATDTRRCEHHFSEQCILQTIVYLWIHPDNQDLHSIYNTINILS